MGAGSLRRVGDSQLLGAGADFALLGIFVSGLPNTLLVQLHRNRNGLRPTFSLYAVYRESGMTFDATVRVEVTDAGARMESLLEYFAYGREFHEAVTVALIAQVRVHFGRAVRRPV